MDVQVEQVENQSVAFIRRVIATDEMTELFDSSFGAVAEAVAEAGGQITGPPFGWYQGMPSDTVDVAAGFPVDGVVAGAIPGSEVVVEERVGGQAVVAMHVGSYDGLSDTYAEVMAWMEDNDLVSRDDMWEEYLTDPGEEPDPSNWQTRLVLPVR